MPSPDFIPDSLPQVPKFPTAKDVHPLARYNYKDLTIILQQLLIISGDTKMKVTGDTSPAFEELVGRIHASAIASLPKQSAEKQALLDDLVRLLDRANQLTDCDITEDEKKDVVNLFEEILDTD